MSGGLLLLVIVALIYFRPPTWPIWLVGVVVAFGAVEAATRGRMRSYLYGVTIALAILNAAILLYEFWFAGVATGAGRAGRADDPRQPARGLWRIVQNGWDPSANSEKRGTLRVLALRVSVVHELAFRSRSGRKAP